MRKSIIALLLLFAMVATTSAQTTLTPEEQLEQAQKQLEEAQKALDAAKANAARAKEEAQRKAEEEARKKAEAEALAKKKADEEAKAKIAELQKQIEETQKETARLQEETRKIESGETVPADNDVKSDAAAKKTEPQEQVSPAQQQTTVSKEPENEEPVQQTIKTRKTSDTKKQKADNKNAKYLSADAVPLVDGRVQWETTVSAPGKSADEIYAIAEKYLNQLTSDDQQLEGSKLGFTDKAKHNLVATVHEWIVFKDNALSLDRSEIYYVLDVDCHDGKATMTMSRIKYKYDVQGDVSRYSAEDWITDKEAVNKAHTRLYPISGKFRRKTIDRKDEIFETFKEAIE